MTKRLLLLLPLLLCLTSFVHAQGSKLDKLLFGVAYYDEYMPYERIDKDYCPDERCGY